jgi:hypothetical protein
MPQFFLKTSPSCYINLQSTNSYSNYLTNLKIKMSHASNACSHDENRLKICLLCTRKIKTKLSSLSPKSIELIRNHVLTDYNISDERFPKDLKCQLTVRVILVDLSRLSQIFPPNMFEKYIFYLSIQ